MSNIDTITQICYLIVVDKVADLPTFPDDPEVFWQPGSGSFLHQVKIA
jgi:hypothetical protein